MKANAHDHGSARHAIEDGLSIGSGDDETGAGPDNIGATVGHNPYPLVLRFAKVVHPDATNMLAQLAMGRVLVVNAGELCNGTSHFVDANTGPLATGFRL